MVTRKKGISKHHIVTRFCLFREVCGAYGFLVLLEGEGALDNLLTGIRILIDLEKRSQEEPLVRIENKVELFTEEIAFHLHNTSNYGF